MPRAGSTSGLCREAARRRVLALGFVVLAATLLLPSLHRLAPHTGPAEAAAARGAAEGSVVVAPAVHDPASCPVCRAFGKLRSFAFPRSAACAGTPETRCLPPRRAVPAPLPLRAGSPAAPRAPPA